MLLPAALVVPSWLSALCLGLMPLFWGLNTKAKLRRLWGEEGAPVQWEGGLATLGLRVAPTGLLTARVPVPAPPGGPAAPPSPTIVRAVATVPWDRPVSSNSLRRP